MESVTVTAEVILPDLLPGTPNPRLAVFDEATARGWLADAELATSIEVTDADSQAKAEAALVCLHSASKDIEARRKALKRPITDLGKAIEQVAKAVSEPVDNAKRLLQTRIAARIRAEREREEAERRKAEEEARKLREQQEAERRRLEAEARAKAEAEAAELAEMLGRKVEPEPVKVELPPAPEIKAAVVAPAAASSAVLMKKVKRLVIDDPALVPCSVGGVEIRPIDKAAVRKLLDAGVAVPGCRIEEAEEVAMRGMR